MSAPPEPARIPQSPPRRAAWLPFLNVPLWAWCLLLGCAAILLWFAISAGGRSALPAARTPALIAEIDLRQGSESVRFQRQDKSWVVTTASGAPAREGAVEALLHQLGRMRVAGPASSNLTTGAAPLVVRLSDRNDRLLGSISLGGVRNDGLTAAVLANGAPPVLVEGAPDLDLDVTRWTAVRVPPLDGGRVRKVTLIDAGGTMRRFSRRDGRGALVSAQPSLDSSAPDLSAIVAAFDAVTKNGVSSARDVNWYGATTLLIETADGLQISVQVQRQAKNPGQAGLWLRLNGDPLPGATLERQQEARAFKSLKAYAFGIPEDAAKPLHDALYRP